MRTQRWSGRIAHAAIVLLLVGLFFWSVKSLLNPITLYFLLLAFGSVWAGSRTYVLLALSGGILAGAWALSATGALLAPFFLALILGYVMHPAVDALERRGHSRARATLLLALPAILLLAAVLGLAIPELIRTLTALAERFPLIVHEMQAQTARWADWLVHRDFALLDEAALAAKLRGYDPVQAIGTWVQAPGAALGAVWHAMSGAGRGMGALASLAGYVVLTPVVTYYVLRDYHVMTARIANLLPATRRSEITQFARRYDTLLASYLRGQCTVALALGAMTALGFLVLGFPHALLLGAITGLFSFVPYLGVLAALVPALTIALFSGAILTALLKIAVVFILVQTLEGMWLSPKIVGDAVALHPVWIMMALPLAAYAFGFAGMLIAVPLAVLVKMLIQVALARYEHSAFYRGERGQD